MLEFKPTNEQPLLEEVGGVSSFDKIIEKVADDLRLERVKLLELENRKKEYMIPSKAGEVRDEVDPKIEQAKNEITRLEGVLTSLKEARNKAVKVLGDRFDVVGNNPPAEAANDSEIIQKQSA